MLETENMAGGELTDQTQSDRHLPTWHYHGVAPEQHSHLPGESVLSFPDLEGPCALDLGTYSRQAVSNLDENIKGRAYFDRALRLMLSYQHENAAKCFLAAVHYSPNCALAHAFLALCHSPNYNFKGEAYYESTCHVDDIGKHELLCVFPSQYVAEKHSKLAVDKVDELRRLHKAPKKNVNKKGNKKGSTKSGKVETPTAEKIVEPGSGLIADVEVQLITAIRILTGCPGVDATLADETVGRPFSEAMRKVYQKYPDDPEVAYCFAESLMVLNAWRLYEYPSGKPLSPDVEETRAVLEGALVTHPQHAGICHMYVHLSEMSAQPELALVACESLRSKFPHAGHLIHMPTHIDVLVGDYESCIKYNESAIVADTDAMKCSPATAGRESFYFGYIVHNFHMGIYGAILGAMEAKAMQLANDLNTIVNEEMFMEFPDLTSYLESYSAMEIHVMVRFGRWRELLEVEAPKDKRLMLYRAASIRYARSLAYAALGNVADAKKEADRFDSLRHDEQCDFRILHNNSVASLLAVDAAMMRGEIAYREEKYDEAFALLRKAVKMQDELNYDEPWGKMQPIRHAYGGLLLEQGHVDDAEKVFRADLELHPKNPWALSGLIRCLKNQNCCTSPDSDAMSEIAELTDHLKEQRRSEWADYNVVVSCECCRHPES